MSKKQLIKIAAYSFLMLFALGIVMIPLAALT